MSHCLRETAGRLLWTAPQELCRVVTTHVAAPWGTSNHGRDTA